MVHPHVRGEYLSNQKYFTEPYGSSPRAWGIPTNILSHQETIWFIPTCVGNTSPLKFSLTLAEVHPHVRGEYNGKYIAIDDLAGSSPRAWGILHKHTIFFPQHWFIPTCVGNTYSSYDYAMYLMVHPHVRGEYTQMKLKTSLRAGSSPRAWGILTSLSSNSSTCWFIPTCVGNT